MRNINIERVLLFITISFVLFAIFIRVRDKAPDGLRKSPDATDYLKYQQEFKYKLGADYTLGLSADGDFADSVDVLGFKNIHFRWNKVNKNELTLDVNDSSVLFINSISGDYKIKFNVNHNGEAIVIQTSPWKGTSAGRPIKTK